MNARILLVEDDRSLGETLSERLRKEGYELEWCRELAAVRRIQSTWKPDLYILDVRLPDGSGFELASELRQAGSSAPFIFLTAQAGAEERLRGFELGAEEFIPKPFHIRELLLRLQHVLSTHRAAEKTGIYTYNEYTIDFNKYRIQKQGQEAQTLSARDMALLGFLIARKGRVVSRDEVLDRLWGEDRFPSNRTIDNAIVRIRQAFGKDGVSVIRSVRGVGYQWTGD